MKKKTKKKFLVFMSDLLIVALLVGGIYGVNYLIPQKGIAAQAMVAQAADRGAESGSSAGGVNQNQKNSNGLPTTTVSLDTQDWSRKYADKFTDQVGSTDTSYTSPHVSVKLSRNTYNTNRLDKTQGGKHIQYGTNISYVLEDIYVSDITCLQTCFAQNVYGVGYDEKLSDMSARLKSVLAVNGDSYSNSRYRNNGTIIRNGVIYRAQQTDMETCMLNWDGTMKIYKPEEMNTQQLIDSGAYQSWIFGSSLLDDNGKAKTTFQTSLAADKTVLLYVGRLAKEKNIEELLLFQKEAAAHETVLMIVGGGPYRGILEKKAGEMKIAGSVIFTGMIPPEEVWKYYQAGDLFISASTSETQGMTYVEALAAGLPLLCRRDGCLEGVVREGENGWQYDDMKQFLIFLGEWSGLDEDGKFAKLFAAAIFFPMAPDDLLCYLAGTTAMTWRQFTCIILLGKPFSIALYSMGLTKLFQFFFPVLVCCVGFAVMGVFPFGSRSALIIDGVHQYLGFYEELLHQIGQGMQWTFSGHAMGYSFYSLFSYYLSSPFNLLVLLLMQVMYVNEAVTLVVLIKIGLTGSCMAWYVQRKMPERGQVSVCIGCMFALSNYVLGYYSNLMWLDCVMLLPVLAWEM